MTSSGHIVRDEVEYIFKPHLGPQTAFLEAGEFEVLHSGGRGSAKSHALVADILHYVGHPDFKGLLLRKQLKDLEQLIERCKQLFFKAIPGTKWKEQDKKFLFPAGGFLWCGYFETDSDVERYQGMEYCVSVDTPILMADGSSKRMGDIQVGDLVATLEGAKPVTHAMEPYLAPCVTIEGEGVKQDHPVWHPFLTSSGWQSYASLLDTNSKEFAETGQVFLPHPSLDVVAKLAVHIPSADDGTQISTGFYSKPNNSRQSFCHNQEFLPLDWQKQKDLQQALGASVKNQGKNLAFDQNAQSLSDASGLGGVLSSQCGCQSDHHLCGGQSLCQQGNGLNEAPLLDDAVEHIHDYLSVDALDSIQLSSRRIERGYQHPYDGRVRETEWESSLVACRMAFSGYKMVRDITVDVANHYITAGAGLVNRNCWIGVDEVCQLSEEEPYQKLLMSLRSSKSDIKKCVRLTANPSGVGKHWVKARFIDPAPMQEVTYIDEEGEENHYLMNRFDVEYDVSGTKIILSRKTINSTVFNNPSLKRDPQYIAQLQSLGNENLRRQWLDGDWDADDGLAFSEFSKRKHICEPFPIPQSWKKFRAADWGFSSRAACLWFAVDPVGRLYVYREYGATNERPEKFAEKILFLEQEEYISYGVLDASAWDNRGATSPAIMMIRMGCTWRPADNKTKGSRPHGKMLVHHYLAEDPHDNKPRLQIFSSCKELIKELSTLPLDTKNPEDVDTDAPDHFYDGLRYGLLSRPAKPSLLSNRGAIIRPAPPVILNRKTGY
jgi:hypothetical protein